MPGSWRSCAAVYPFFSSSYDLLTPELQRLWSLLSVFPADFDLAGAAAVWEMEQLPAEDALGELVKWSLVDFQAYATGEGGRYRLHDLARDSSGSRLDSKDLDQAQQHHSTHYHNVLSIANQIFMQKDNSLAGLALFDQEKMNIFAGQSWSEMKMHTNASAIALCKTFPNAGAYVLDLRLSPKEKIPWLDAGIQASRISKDRAMESVHLGNLGLAYLDLGDPHQAIDYYNQALKISHVFRDRRSEGADLGSLGIAYYHLGDLGTAIDYHNQALKISCEIGDRRGERNQLGNLGLAYSHLDDPRKSIEYYDQALKIARERGDRKDEGNWLGNIGSSYFDLSEPRKAIEYDKQALKSLARSRICAEKEAIYST
jgi:tetratricopeptide (TPR) repeat protein